MNPFNLPRLPQNDDNPMDRLEALEEFRKKFQFDYSVVDGLPISAQVPEEAKAGTGWSLKVVATSYQLRRNWEAVLEKNDYVFEKPLPQKSASELAGMLAASDLVGILSYTNPDLGVALKDKRPESFEQYLDLFIKLELPIDPADIYDDNRFADYFVAGLNPVMLEGLKQLKPNMALSNENLRGLDQFAGESIASLMADDRLFVVDYSLLAGIESGEHPDQKKYGYSPIVYLGVPRGGSSLEVIGIQLGQDGSSYPIASPVSGKWDWLVAKTMVKSADINYHEVITHLGLTHLLIDPIVVSTFRQLAPSHPLNVLLLPHFEGTIPINTLAVKRLLPKNGRVEQLLSGRIETAYDVLRNKRQAYGFRENFFPNTFKNRGVDENSKLANYPYRDDGMLIWEAISKWIEGYVDFYYESDSDVVQDKELAAWVAEISDDNGGSVPDFAPNGQILTKEVLVETLTMIIFTASAQHAAVNFPQGTAAAVPYQPMAGYIPAPKSLGLTEQDAIDLLPPLDRAMKQTHTNTLLGQVYYTQLGGYALGTFNDKRLVPLLWDFQSRLEEIETIISDRNKERRTPYVHLMPSRIPQSINI